MKTYKRILVAVELIEKTDVFVLKRAQCLAEKYGAQISIVHAVEYLGGYNVYDTGIELEQVLMNNALQTMQKLGKHLNVDEQNQIIKGGSAKFVVLEAAEETKADLIIVGSHGRHGIRALLGSTANAILHGATCDVLAVRFNE